MADKQKALTPKSGMNEKLSKRNQGRIGDNVADESKERHTEIAVEAGEKFGHLHSDKR